ncbi:PrpF domain-containing protein [Streptomyces sp. MMG1121]|uniref:PrpF domain-containing protein n=1 Tax=Streptomyces sp. MMG1121 TaxID=1415544 RepID=UPI000A508D48|nr:PrpF domain-containing protein [Streptomyces sp. MMG1121]
MIQAHIAYAKGSPSPTLTLPADALPEREEELEPALREAVRHLAEHGGGLEKITKIALIAPSRHPLFDIDYRFVQVMPGTEPRFDFHGSCGHSVLSSVMVASRLGWVHRLAPDHRVRVNVLNNGDHVVCEVDDCERDRATFTAHFMHHPAVCLDALTYGGGPTTSLVYEDGSITASCVSVSNPYVFVNAADLGVRDADQLFTDDPRLFEVLQQIRSAAADVYGLPRGGAFPKIAALLPDGDGTIAVRAISVPTWHPTIALTGAVCVGAASKMVGTVPYALAGSAAVPGAPLTIRTAGGTTAVRAAVTGNTPADTLAWVSVAQKSVEFTGSLTLERLQPYAQKEALPYAHR